jgi:hypothetical protein
MIENYIIYRESKNLFFEILGTTQTAESMENILGNNNTNTNLSPKICFRERSNRISFVAAIAATSPKHIFLRGSIFCDAEEKETILKA